jgi:TRAP-type C4-dicarboxylate transport system permease small subunit
VNLPDFVRTTTFRWTSIGFVVCILLFSAFVYWEAAAYMQTRMDATIAEESIAIASNKPDRQLNAIEDRLSEDPRRIKLAGLFDEE